MSLQDILNYYPVDERIASSGQPGADQFADIAAAGYQAVINLALPDSRAALADEGSIVSGLGLAYLHIPVSWESPRINDVKLFFGLMQALAEQRVWVHCAMNMRVTCFLYLYGRHVLGQPEEEAGRAMRAIWKPQGPWLDLIAAAQEAFGA